MVIQRAKVPGFYHMEVWVHGPLPDPDRYLLARWTLNDTEYHQQINRWIRQFDTRLTIDLTVRK